MGGLDQNHSVLHTIRDSVRLSRQVLACQFEDGVLRPSVGNTARVCARRCGDLPQSDNHFVSRMESIKACRGTDCFLGSPSTNKLSASAAGPPIAHVKAEIQKSFIQHVSKDTITLKWNDRSPYRPLQKRFNCESPITRIFRLS